MERTDVGFRRIRPVKTRGGKGGFFQLRILLGVAADGWSINVTGDVLVSGLPLGETGPAAAAARKMVF